MSVAEPASEQPLPEEERLLAAVGLSEIEERTYVLLIGAPRLTAAELAERLHVPARRVQEVLSSLERQGLVSRSLTKPPEYLPSPPDVVVPGLVLRRQEELQQVRLAAVKLAEQARRAAARREIGPEMLELLSGSEAIDRRFVQLQSAAEVEVCALDRPPYSTNGPLNPSEFAALDRGVAYRAIYDPEALAGPGQPDALRGYLSAGEQARIFPNVPTKMIVVDGKAALIPLDSHSPGTEALLLRAPAVVDTLQMFFEVLWAQATPLVSAPTDAHELNGEGGVNSRNEELVTMLAAGLKDEAIARRLGISPRTLDRRVQTLMRTLTARTRFQAGWQAACRFHAAARSDGAAPAQQP